MKPRIIFTNTLTQQGYICSEIIMKYLKGISMDPEVDFKRIKPTKRERGVQITAAAAALHHSFQTHTHITMN